MCCLADRTSFVLSFMDPLPYSCSRAIPVQMSSSRLPAPLPEQVYVTVSPIGDQSFTFPEKSFIKPAEDDARGTVPSLSFLITHPNPPSTLPWLDKRTPSPPLGHPLRLLFDLGLRKNADAYSTQQQQHLKKREPHELSTSVAEVLLQKGDVKPQDIDLVILSHVHYVRPLSISVTLPGTAQL